MIIDGFCGAGGASEGIRRAGGGPVIGIDFDANACRVHQAAGHLTIRADIAAMDTSPLAGKVSGIWMSPPCTAWSMAGNRGGEQDKHLVYACLEALARGEDRRAEYRALCVDDRSMLVVEPFRWVLDLRPEWLACEQVPPVLELWEWMADRLRDRGYSAWAGVLNSADVGVPQTRQRAILMASRVKAAIPPEPTHCRGGAETLFGSLKPWVSMAESLSWQPVGVPSVDGLSLSPAS